MKDPYEVLGIDRSASTDDVKAAFRKLAAKHHPDRNPDDAEAPQRFKEINAAYQILSDPKKREMFDRFGVGDGTRASPGGMPFDFSEVSIDGIFGDLLGALGVRPGQPAPLQKEVKLTFEESAFGATKEITYERIESCDECHGSGAAAGTTADTCGPCKGRGKVRVSAGMLPIAIERPCPTCRGTGRVVKDPCKKCHGSGLGTKKRTIEVTVPAGVENGATRIVERAGNFTRSDRPAGDLELVIRVAPHEYFRRAGDDVVCSLAVSFPQAALGGEIEVPTLDGKGKLKIPAGTQPGTVLRIRGRGMPRRMVTGRGDQLVEIAVEVPRQLSDDQRKIIEQLAGSLGNKIQPAAPEPSLMDRLKNLFS